LIASNPLQFLLRGIFLAQTPWFLYTLFFSSVISFFILKSKSRYMIVSFIVIAFICNMMKGFFIQNHYLLNFTTILHYALIFLAGHHFVHKDRRSLYRLPLLVSCVLFVSVYFLNDLEIRKLPYLYPFKLLSIFALIYISFFGVRIMKWFKENNFLKWAGRHALQIYVLHYLYLVLVPYDNDSPTIFIISYLAVTTGTILTHLILQRISILHPFFRQIYRMIFGITSR
jgi:hypothetical protein